MHYLGRTPFSRVGNKWKREIDDLKELALDVFIEDTRKRLYVDVSKVPKEYGEHMWGRLSLIEIIRTASNSNAVEWFSENVTGQLKNVAVDLREHDGGLGNVKIDRKRWWSFEEESEWNSQCQSETFYIRIGEHLLPTRIERISSRDSMFRQEVFSTTSMMSKLPTKDIKFRIDIIQWICKFFHCDIESFEFDDSRYCQNWDFSKENGYIVMETCTDADFITRILPQREQKESWTLIKKIQIEEPIQINPQVFADVEIKEAQINLTTSDFQSIVSFYQQMITLYQQEDSPFEKIWPTVSTRIPNWTSDLLENFKRSLGLKDLVEELNETHKERDFMEDFEKKMYEILEDGAVFVVYVKEKENGAYDQIGCARWPES